MDDRQRARGVDADAVGTGGDGHAQLPRLRVTAALHAACAFESPITNRVASSIVFRCHETEQRHHAGVVGRMLESVGGLTEDGTTGIPSHTSIEACDITSTPARTTSLGRAGNSVACAHTFMP